MGKKATLLLSRILFALLTLILAALAVVGWFAGVIPPQKSWFIALIGIGMTPLLASNAITFFFWLFRRSWWALIPIAAILLNANYIRTCFQFDFGSTEEHCESYLKVGTYNMHGHGHKDFEWVLTEILDYFERKEVDVICLQEFCTKEGDLFDSISHHYPYHIVIPGSKCMQLAIFSRHPIQNPERINFGESNNCAMIAEMEVGGRNLKLVNLHFQTTNLNQSHHEISQIKDLGIDNPDGKKAFDLVMQRLSVNATVRTEQVNKVRAAIDENATFPIIVCGDFNDPPSSYTYHLMKKQLIDGFMECGKGYTFTFNHLFKIFRLDFILYSKDFKGILYHSETLPWSDHNPVIIDLAIRKTPTQ